MYKNFLALFTIILLTSCTGSETNNTLDTQVIENETTKSFSNATLLAIADTGDCREPASQVAKALENTDGTIVIAGDLAYPTGSTEDFKNCFTPLFSSMKDRLWAVPGDNEYKTGSADPFFDALGEKGGERGEGWFSFDLEAWQVIGLNSQCPAIGGCDENSPQYQWLEKQLTSSDKACKIAFWHQPRFTSSPNYQGFPRLEAMYQLLQDNGTDVLVVGNSHHYERFARLDAQGNVDAENGIRNFTAGIGGAPLGQEFLEPALSGSEVRNTDTRGYLKFNLAPDNYEWEFVRVGSVGGLVDSGTDSC